MNRREFQIGPGAASLLLIAVVLCMGVLGALSLVSARGDARLSERSAVVAQEAAELSAHSERVLAELDATLKELSETTGSNLEYLEQIAEHLPEGVELNDRTVSWVESAEGGRRVTCAAEIAQLGRFPRVQWVEHRVWTQLEEANPEDELLYSDPGALMLPGEDPGELELDLT